MPLFHLDRLACALLLGGALAFSPAVTAPAYAQAGPASVADLAEGLLDAVVNISTSQNRREGPATRPEGVPRPRVPEGSPFQDFFDEFFNQPESFGPRRVQSLGSGFVVDAEEGIIITNNHVIADADEIEVNFSDGGKLSAQLLGTDPQTDIAVLKVEPGSRQLTEVSFGESDALRIGDWVMAIGNPFGLGGTVTVGIVSARDRDINSGPYDDFIQTDAAINRGNSGGPLFNMEGEVIGINTAIISPSGGSIGIGFAIPSQLALGVIGQLREFGETRRGWLGVRIQPVTDDVAESLGMERTMGALVAGIMAGGPVADGTIEPGDVIVSFDGRQILTMRDLPRVVAESPVGEEVEVEIVRNGERMTVQVTLGRLEDSERLAEAQDASEDQPADSETEVETATVLGMRIAALNDETRAEFGIDNSVGGVVITEVEEGSAAAEKGIAAGDVITEIAQEAVSSPQEAVDRVDALRSQGRRNALLMLSTGAGELRFEALRMN